MKNTIAALMLLPLAALAAEKKIAEKEVPKVVLDAVKAKHPSAKLVAFEREDNKGKTVFEVGIDESGARTDIDVSPEGKLLVEESDIKVADVPAAVMKAFEADKKHAGWKAVHAEKVVDLAHPDAPRYELAVENGKKKAEVLFERDGAAVKPEAE